MLRVREELCELPAGRKYSADREFCYCESRYAAAGSRDAGVPRASLPNRALTRERRVVYRFRHTGENLMASRREFLQLGVAAFALPITVHTGLLPEASNAPGDAAFVPLYKVIFDERYQASRAFAAKAESLGASINGIKGDITDLWFHDLDLRWRQGPAAIAGLTGHGALFCLERLAWDRRMRVVFRGEHEYLAGGVRHALAGPESVLREASSLESSGQDWGELIARLVMQCPAVRSEAAEAAIVSRRAGQEDDPERLYSWVIAPVRTAQ